jgi:T-complex protein 1 subunit beta
MANQGAPVQILQDNAYEEKGEMAQMSNMVGAMALADLLKTTLGPKGMDKILQSSGGNGKVEVTNDGATILKSIMVNNPAARILIEISKTQDDEVGDGTTSVCVFAGELLREAEKLLSQKIHPQTIIAGWRKATSVAYEALQKSSKDNREDQEKFKQDLLNIARTTLSSKILTQEKEHFANLAVEAVLRLKGSTNLDSIQIIKKPGGSMRDSFLSDGYILNKSIGVGQPKLIENAKVLVANTPMDTDKIKIYGIKVTTNSMMKMAEIEAAEKNKMKQKCEKILGHGINVFINRQLIYDYPQEFFADNGVMAIEHADFDGIERLALVLGAEIVSTFDHPDQVVLGTAAKVEQIMIGEDRLIKFSGCKRNEACTIVLRGANAHLLEEAERSLHDALCVLSQTVVETRTVLGGGCSEMIMAKAVLEVAKKTPGKEAIAMEAFANALKQIPTIIADNAGLDSAELVSVLEAAHYQDKSTYGIDVNRGDVGDMIELGITESFKVKQQILLSASEAAEMIIRVDDVLHSAPRQRRGQ